MSDTAEIFRDDLRRALGMETPEPAVREGRLNGYTRDYLSRNEILRGIPIRTIRKAWFTMAHLLLPANSTVVDMGCRDGQMVYVMAALNPHLSFLGVDLDQTLIEKALKNYSLPNLSFRVGDVTGDIGLAPASVDAIVNSFILHEIYSSGHYHDRLVVNTLGHHLSLLKPEGKMFIRDFPMPPPGEFVLMEMPDRKGSDASIANMSEPELLIWYSEHARPMEDPGCHGFYMEELPPRFPNTRMFRLPYKWAYEFIARKDDRKNFEAELHKEFSFFTQRDFRKALRDLGARVLYSSPHWDDAEIRNRFDGHFRLYTDDGSPLGAPPTSYISIAQKISDGESLRLSERRPSQKAGSHIRIHTMRNERDGRLVDVVSRDTAVTEIIPYRINEHDELTVFLHDGLPRGIINSVPRAGKNLDEKYWSGHMTEAISVDARQLAAYNPEDAAAVASFAADMIGLRPLGGALLERGPGFLPAPDYIEDQIGTRYLRVEAPVGPVAPRAMMADTEGFTTRGRIREIPAQAVLNAITVGLIPSSRLEIQMIALFQAMGRKPETWDDNPLVLKEEEPLEKFDVKKFNASLAEEDASFRKARGSAGQLRAVQSIFVDEGLVNGGVSGVGSKDLEFVISDENTVNKVVVLPLTRNAKGTVMAGVSTEYMPVPQRFKGNGLMLRAPSFDLPKDIKNLHQVKKFIADQFGVGPENVFRLGESFFSHIGVTPQRVFPFAVAAPRGPNKITGGPVQFMPTIKLWYLIWRIWDWNCDQVLIAALYRTCRRLGQDGDMRIDFTKGEELVNAMVHPTHESFEDIMGMGFGGGGGTHGGENSQDIALPLTGVNFGTSVTGAGAGGGGGSGKAGGGKSGGKSGGGGGGGGAKRRGGDIYKDQDSQVSAFAGLTSAAVRPAGGSLPPATQAPQPAVRSKAPAAAPAETQNQESGGGSLAEYRSEPAYSSDWEEPPEPRDSRDADDRDIAPDTKTKR